MLLHQLRRRLLSLTHYVSGKNRAMINSNIMPILIIISTFCVLELIRSPIRFTT